MNIQHVVSVSGGKDSTATLLLALKQFPGAVSAVFADTGNEHEATHEYLDYLQDAVGVPITRIKADFSDRFASKRRWIRDKWPTKGVPADRVEKALELLHPTGNPYLDLCMLKGQFPSRTAQFCTQELKVLPITDLQMDIVDLTGCDVWSWQGVRRDESPNRANALGFESIGAGIWANRPIAGWTAQMVVDFVVKFCGLKLNPLYSLGMSRVGCMPCINASKVEIAEIARRFPEHIARIAEWEALVAQVTRSGWSSFFRGSGNRAEYRGVVQFLGWAKTLHGGRVADPEWDQPAPACASAYGLCE